MSWNYTLATEISSRSQPQSAKPVVLVRARNRKGDIMWYTGGSGENWVSFDQTKAWTGYNLEGAKRFCERHNSMYAFHGLKFEPYTIGE